MRRRRSAREGEQDNLFERDLLARYGLAARIHDNDVFDLMRMVGVEVLILYQGDARRVLRDKLVLPIAGDLAIEDFFGVYMGSGIQRCS